MKMMIVMLAATLLAGGCESFSKSQVDLTQQAKAGVAIARQSVEDRSQQAQGYFALQRKRLDDAYVEDINQQPQLERGWVIEHGQAFGIALDVLASAKIEQAKRDATDARNFDAIDESLDTLLELQRLQAKLLSAAKEVKP